MLKHTGLVLQRAAMRLIHQGVVVHSSMKWTTRYADVQEDRFSSFPAFFLECLMLKHTGLVLQRAAMRLTHQGVVVHSSMKWTTR
jgi:hypothetical protein